MRQERLERLSKGLGVIAIISAVIVLHIWGFLTDRRTKQGYEKVTRTLVSMSSKHIVTFRIYPRVGIPVGIPREFSVPDGMIEEFCQALGDIHSYQYDHDTVVSETHSWFLEFDTETERLQISFHIPSDRREIVVGELGEFNVGGGGPHYGYFQSRQLYHWYQKYSHRWLVPDGSQPAPVPQPEPPDGG